MTAVTIDQRGHGESYWVEDGRYRFRDYADDIVAVVDTIWHECGAAPVAIGASLGGIASTLAQGVRPEGVLSALVLVDVVPRMDPGGVDRITGFMAERMHEGFGSVEEAADAVAAKRLRSTEGLRKKLRLHSDGRYRWHWDPRFLMGAFSVSADRSGRHGANGRCGAWSDDPRHAGSRREFGARSGGECAAFYGTSSARRVLRRNGSRAHGGGRSERYFRRCRGRFHSVAESCVIAKKRAGRVAYAASLRSVAGTCQTDSRRLLAQECGWQKTSRQNRLTSDVNLGFTMIFG
ncbi:hypothetical protein [Breoghania sp.]|uniref:alpha/beta fold hydrolase n=1 Tax=Breoghania sp. TaxID=2065378 RepID=UPI002605D3D0|nr:hypothetical protein [Breoghania sp.]MDJ0931978.1 hypothetical protein [Breoghania sp.]